MGTAVIVEAVRTPIRRRGGVLAGLHAAEILGCAQTALLEWAEVDPGRVERLCTKLSQAELCHHSRIRGSIFGMKVSVSLPDEDVEFLDSYARARDMGSRSAVVHKAVGLLRASQLERAYEEAWAAWRTDGDDQAWEVTAGDGLGS